MSAMEALVVVLLVALPWWWLVRRELAKLTDARYLRAHGLAPRDLAGVIGLSGPYDFRIGPAFRPVFAGRGDDAQAVRFVDGDEPPFLLVHGARDAVVESVDSEILAQRLREARIPVRVVMLAEGTHTTPLAGLYEPARAPRVLRAIDAFVLGQPGEATRGAVAP